MADHSKPTLSSTYLNFVDEVKGRLEDISKQFDPASGSSSNLGTGTIRWTSAAKKWEIWNGTSWANLAAEYAISISGSAAKLKTARSIALSGGATAAAVNFDGSENITLKVTELDPVQLSSAVPVNKGGTGASDVAQARANLGLGTAATASADTFATKTELSSGLDGKANSSHTHSEYATKTELSNGLGGKANISHSHVWSQITGAPATATRWPAWGEVTGKPAVPPTQQSIAHLGVGQLCMVCSQAQSGFLVAGNTYAGSALRLSLRTMASANLVEQHASSSNLPGTWRALGSANSGTGAYSFPGTIAIRIS